MRWLTGLLITLLLALQYPLWIGPGCWPQVWHTRRQLADQLAVDRQLAERNAAMSAEVRDLKQGVGAIEERARQELGMVRKDEVYFQILDATPAGTPAVRVGEVGREK